MSSMVSGPDGMVRPEWGTPTVQRFNERELAEEFSSELLAQPAGDKPAIDSLLLVTCSPISTSCDPRHYT